MNSLDFGVCLPTLIALRRSRSADDNDCLPGIAAYTPQRYAAGVKIFLVLPAILLSSAISPLHAEVDDYQRLVDAFASEKWLMEDFEADAAVKLDIAYEVSPEIVESELECPGIIAAMTEALMPALSRWQLRGVREYRTGLLDLFRNRLDPADAGLAADFYASENGQAIVKLTGDSASVANTQKDVRFSENMSASEEAIAADMELAASDWFQRFIALKPDMERLELELLNGAFSAEENAEMYDAIDATLTEECYSATD
ncbi:hypothetical protein [Qipengyuania qiaonensis]|uniref:DUF2059 domain-containing protein n=1 Tax=Qipengyuania qiaonensis TaxID=2867240 RepID=A0ABS7J8J0_9SPHN|nr:hypothetical protein [Qipengyuania qiaonensis]MBX7483626.1 hypothetical protein [Qipengyuania qiaonensis]